MLHDQSQFISLNWSDHDFNHSNITPVRSNLYTVNGSTYSPKGYLFPEDGSSFNGTVASSGLAANTTKYKY